MSTADVDVEPAKKTKNAAKVNVKAAKMAASPAKAKSSKPKDKAVKTVAALLKQISDPTRVAALLNLANGTLNVSEICASLGDPSQPAVSHHLALLKHGGIVEAERKGKSCYYDLTAKGKNLVKAIRSVVESENA